jgi:hypothetical protein
VGVEEVYRDLRLVAERVNEMVMVKDTRGRVRKFGRLNWTRLARLESGSKLIEKKGDKRLSLQDVMFCKLYAQSGNGVESAGVAYGKHYSKSWLCNLARKLIKMKPIQDKISEFREKFFESEGESIGKEILSRARSAGDKEALGYYKLAVDIIGMEAPKKSERKEERVFSLPEHMVEQDVEVVVEGEEVKQIGDSLEAAVEGDEVKTEEGEDGQVRGDEFKGS